MENQSQDAGGESSKVDGLAAADDGGAGGGGAGLNLVSLVDEGKISLNQPVQTLVSFVRFLLARQFYSNSKLFCF